MSKNTWGGGETYLFLDSFHLKLCSTSDSQEHTTPRGKVFFSDGVAFKSSASIELVDFSTGQLYQGTDPHRAVSHENSKNWQAHFQLSC